MSGNFRGKIIQEGVTVLTVPSFWIKVDGVTDIEKLYTYAAKKVARSLPSQMTLIGGEEISLKLLRTRKR